MSSRSNSKPFDLGATIMERNYYVKCYIAFYYTLHNIFKKSKKPIAPHPFSLCDLLSDMCPFTFTTGMSADPAAYFDYETILKSLNPDIENETADSGYAAGQKFLQMYAEEYEYELQETIENFIFDDYALAYEKVSVESK